MNGYKTIRNTNKYIQRVLISNRCINENQFAQNVSDNINKQYVCLNTELLNQNFSKFDIINVFIKVKK